VFQQVFTQLALAASGSEVSQAVSMGGANAATVNINLAASIATNGTVTILLQASNDLENWSTAATLSPSATYGTINPASALARLLGGVTGLASQYVRLFVQANANTGAVMMAAGINTYLA